MCEKNDPFRHVYDEIERKEVYVSILFYITTALSFLATFRDKLSSTFPLISSFDYDHWVPIAITLTSLSGFLLSLFIREYSFPNSEERGMVLSHPSNVWPGRAGWATAPTVWPYLPVTGST